MTHPIALTPNVTLRKSIEEWAEKNATWMLVSSPCGACCAVFLHLVNHLSHAPEPSNFDLAIVHVQSSRHCAISAA